MKERMILQQVTEIKDNHDEVRLDYAYDVTLACGHHYLMCSLAPWSAKYKRMLRARPMHCVFCEADRNRAEVRS